QSVGFVDIAANVEMDHSGQRAAGRDDVSHGVGHRGGVIGLALHLEAENDHLDSFPRLALPDTPERRNHPRITPVRSMLSMVADTPRELTTTAYAVLSLLAL